MYNSWKLILALVVFGYLLTTGATAQETADDIRVMLEARDVDIKALVGTDDDISDEAREDLRSVINDVIDFRAMGEGALGRHWSKLTAEQQDEFVETFAKIIRNQSLASLSVYRADVAYGEITVSDAKARVVTTTTYKDVPTEVIYELRFTGKEWLATDIILDEVSTVRGYARSFQSVIRKKGFDELMAKLRKKLIKVESST